ncbi:MAG TPA: hypothetical protein VKV22_03315 [Rhodanobacteraceae bacterium]|nr:hypothetical protein [Rhodanobacteraceae bacterium]
MPHRSLATSNRQPDLLNLAAATWLACGAVLLGLTPLPLRDATLGWSPAFWLLAAPCLLLLARRVLAWQRAPKSARHKMRPARRTGVQAIRRGAIRVQPGPRTRGRAWRVAA